MASAVTALANVTVASNSNSVTFSSISQSYKDLIIVIRAINVNYSTQLSIAFNGTSVASVNGDIYGNGAAAFSSATGANYISTDGARPVGGAQVGMRQVNVMNYSNTDMHKWAITKFGSPTSYGAGVVTGRWASNSAVTSVTVTNGGTFAPGSTITLYGVSA
jgi:hypothetical protein